MHHQSQWPQYSAFHRSNWFSLKHQIHLIRNASDCQHGLLSSKGGGLILARNTLPGSILRHGFKEEISPSLWHGHKQEQGVELWIMYLVLNVIVPTKYTKCLMWLTLLFVGSFFLRAPGRPEKHYRDIGQESFSWLTGQESFSWLISP